MRDSYNVAIIGQAISALSSVERRRACTNCTVHLLNLKATKTDVATSYKLNVLKAQNRTLFRVYFASIRRQNLH